MKPSWQKLTASGFQRSVWLSVSSWQHKFSSGGREGDQRSVYQFFHVVKDGANREVPVGELLSFKRGPADDKVADILSLPRSSKDSEVFKLRNLLRISGSPVAVYDIVIPCALFKGLNESVIRNFGRTLYGVYQSRYGITIVSTAEELRAVKADSTVARSLKVRRVIQLLK